MPQLLGFVPSIKLEMTFSGLELLYLYRVATKHYDGACQAAALSVDSKYRRKNGLIIRMMMYLGGPHGGYLDWDGTDEEYLEQNLEAESHVTLTWDEVDLLAKISEGFDISGMQKRFFEAVIPGLTVVRDYDIDIATGIYMALRKALKAANQQFEDFMAREKHRRQKALTASPE